MQILFAVLLSLQAVSAHSAEQSDWSGGPGVTGPVSSFGNSFLSDTPSLAYSEPGQLTLVDGTTEHSTTTSIGGWGDICAGDIDLDGDMDIAGAGYVSDYVAWWENANGLGSCWIEHSVCWECSSAVEIDMGDMDSDGDPDLVVTSYGFDKVVWFENGSSWEEHSIASDFWGAYSVVVRDIDGDADQDVIASSLADRIACWINLDGTGTSWQEYTIATAIDIPTVISAADIDSDGDMDIAGVSSGDSLVYWWENVLGTGTTWNTHIVDYGLSGPWAVGCSDIDSDGRMDVMAAALSDTVIWCRNLNGTGTAWERYIISTDMDGPNCVNAADLDEDGDMDVLAGANFGDELLWFENIDGTGATWSPHLISDQFEAPGCVLVPDIDGDGHADVTSCEYWLNTLTWWDLNLNEIDGSLESSILDTGMDPSWDSIDWVATQPGCTSVGFQVRASDDYNSMGEWSDTLQTPGSLVGILEDGDSYVQYRALLGTEDPNVVPVLNAVSLFWDQLGVSGDSPVAEYHLYDILPNPSPGTVCIRYDVPEETDLELMIYDLSGRVVHLDSHNEVLEGEYSETIEFPNPGLYFCRLTCSDFISTKRFTVID
mgnify:CR=1 FL=1